MAFLVDEKKLVDEAALKFTPVLQAMADKAVTDAINGLVGRTFTIDGLIPGRTITIKVE